MNYSPELDTLDQLQGRARPLKLIHQIYPDTAHFCAASMAC